MTNDNYLGSVSIMLQVPNAPGIVARIAISFEWFFIWTAGSEDLRKFSIDPLPRKAQVDVLS